MYCVNELIITVSSNRFAVRKYVSDKSLKIGKICSLKCTFYINNINVAHFYFIEAVKACTYIKEELFHKSVSFAF